MYGVHFMRYIGRRIWIDAHDREGGKAAPRMAGAILHMTYFGMGDKQEIEIFVMLEVSCLDEDGNMPQSIEKYQVRGKRR